MFSIRIILAQEIFLNTDEVELFEPLFLLSEMALWESMLGVSIQTLRRWEEKGDILSSRRSEGGTRYYDVDKLLGLQNKEADLTIGYARVSSRDQKDDLKRQTERLETFCTAKGWSYEIIQDLGSCKQEEYFLQACGVARFTWNWALAEWKRQYEAGEKPNGLNLKKQFNAIKPVEFPWMYKVTKYASQQPFIFLQKSFQRFFKKRIKLSSV